VSSPLYKVWTHTAQRCKQVYYSYLCEIFTFNIEYMLWNKDLLW